MTYPGSPLTVEVDLKLGTTWTDAIATGGGVRHAAGIQIDSGRSDWASQVDAASCRFTLDNTDGRWSPDYVGGAYYGSYKRNIPCRVGVGLGSNYLLCAGQVGLTGASTPSTGVLSFSTAHDVRVGFQLDSDPRDITRGGLRMRLADKAIPGASDGWYMSIYMVGEDVVASWTWFDSGGTQRAATTDQTGGGVLPYWIAYRPSALRVTWDPSTGTTTWYYSDSLAGTWTQVGAPVVSGATSLRTTTGQVTVGGDAVDAFGHSGPPGRVYGFELRNGIGGTVVANPDWTAQALGAASFVDAAGRTWTQGTGGRVSNLRWRFHGELSSLPVRWDLSGHDVTAPVEAGGILRRLRQGSTSLEGAYRRGVTRSMVNLVDYWPCEEDGDLVTQFGAAVGRAPLTISGGVPSSVSGRPFPASDGMRQLGTTIWTASVDSYTSGGAWTLRWLMAAPATGYPTGADLRMFHIWTTDLSWHVAWSDTGGGEMKVIAFRDPTGVVYDSGWIGMDTIGKPMRMQLTVSTNGSNVDVTFTGQPANQATPGGVVVTNAVAGNPGVVTQIRVNPDSNHGSIGLGHITLQSNTVSGSELQTALNAWDGELAAARVHRLCIEEGLASRIKGDRYDSEPMGPQLPSALADLLQECAATDGGILYEARDSVAVAYRTRVSMQSQTAAAFDYALGQLADTPQLDRDDNGFANDVTATATVGTSGRAVLNDGSNLSVSQPPVGAGRYPKSYQVNCAPGRPPDIAGALLRLATVDEPRVTNIAVDTNLAGISVSSALTEQVLALAFGDLISAANLPAVTLGSTLVRQLVQGMSETIGMFSHRFDLNTTPASPWDTAVYG